MLEEFDKYVSNYNLEDINIKLKYNHSYRVMKLSEKYATMLGFSEYDIKLATVIGLLHDIGRFEQLKVYHTYEDAISIDHALYGIKELFEKGHIKKFWKNEEDYELIRFAIYNHNKFKIEKTEDERILMHTHLIRDTDKIDIMFLLGYLKELDLKADDSEISEDMITSARNHKQAIINKALNNNDNIAKHFAFAFDIYNDICLEEFKSNMEYFYNQVEKNNTFKEIYEITLNYINERMDKNVRTKV